MTKRREVQGLEVFFQGASEGEGTETEALAATKTEKLQEVITEKRKERVNYYIDSRLVEALDKAQVEIRSLIKKKITKSDIVSAALEQALREFNEKRKDSTLLKVLKSVGM